jgi:hypothetical protein
MHTTTRVVINTLRRVCRGNVNALGQEECWKLQSVRKISFENISLIKIYSGKQQTALKIKYQTKISIETKKNPQI